MTIQYVCNHICNQNHKKRKKPSNFSLGLSSTVLLITYQDLLCPLFFGLGFPVTIRQTPGLQSSQGFALSPNLVFLLSNLMLSQVPGPTAHDSITSAKQI